MFIIDITKIHFIQILLHFIFSGGDLYHDNRPTRFTEHECMKILSKHVYGDAPISIEFASDPEVNFAHCDENHRIPNYLDPNLNIALPLFSIHGNHDDPSGLGQYCSLDNLHTAGLINYFGRVDNLDQIEGEIISKCIKF